MHVASFQAGLTIVSTWFVRFQFGIWLKQWHVYDRAPQIADLGEEGRESWLELELKLVADVGIIGVPNAGKSTLLSVITAGQHFPLTVFFQYHD